MGAEGTDGGVFGLDCMGPRTGGGGEDDQLPGFLRAVVPLPELPDPPDPP